MQPQVMVLGDIVLTSKQFFTLFDSVVDQVDTLVKDVFCVGKRATNPRKDDIVKHPKSVDHIYGLVISLVSI